MVGVAGRSKGCGTCRARKVACSLEKPRCLRCAKAGRECKGYARQYLFIDNDESVIAAQRRASRNKRASIPTRTERTSQQDHPSASRQELESLIAVQVSPSPEYRQQLFNQYLESSFALSRLFGPSQWLLAVSQVSGPSEALEAAKCALATARLGRLHKDDSLLMQSRRCYIHALSALKKALLEPRHAKNDDTLAACVALCRYEVIECPNESTVGWQSHTHGCEQLLMMKRPGERTRLGHESFRYIRFQAILLALDRRQAKIISKDMMSKRSWQIFPKTLHDQLLDMLVTALGLCNEAQEISCNESRKTSTRAKDLQCSMSQLDSEMTEFYQEYELSMSTSLLFWPIEPEHCIADISDIGLLFPVAFEFANLDVASTLVLYWATLAMLWNAMVYLEELAERRSPLNTRGDALSMAQRVCQSVSFFLRREMGDTGPSNAIVPLRMVAEIYRSMANAGDELYWVQDVLSRICCTSGARVIRFDPQYITKRIP